MLLGILASAIAVGLLTFGATVSKPTPNHESTKAGIPLQQTKLRIRRDIYGQRAGQPAHTILQCQETELTFDLITKELVEHMSGVQGRAFHQGFQDDFLADMATYNHKQSLVTASAVKGSRSEGKHKIVNAHSDYAEVRLTSAGLKFEGRNIYVQDGTNQSLTLDSHLASYDGSTLYLEGQITIGLPTGKLLADKAVIHPQTYQGDLSGNLSLLMNSGGLLQADHCHVNQTEGTATFTASDQVSYYEPNFEAKKPLTLTCQKLTVQAPDLNQAGISQIVAKGEVEAIYDESWELSADRAIYLNGSERRLSVDGDLQGGCTITSPNNDHLTAKRIESTLSDHRVTFYELKGELRDGLTMVDADEASWDPLTSVLTCRQNTHLRNDRHGNLQADGELKLKLQKEDGTLALATAHHLGSLNIQGTDKELSCQGESILDHQNRQISLNADETGAITCVDTVGQLAARKLSIWYDWANQHFTTTKLRAEDEVQLQRSQEGATQLTLADTMEYLPDQDKVTLRAYPTKRVLYYDPSRQMTASAKGVDIVRDPLTRKVSLQGKGDVQFKLMEAELQAMRQYLQGVKHGKK